MNNFISSDKLHYKYLFEFNSNEKKLKQIIKEHFLLYIKENKQKMN